MINQNAHASIPVSAILDSQKEIEQEFSDRLTEPLSPVVFNPDTPPFDEDVDEAIELDEEEILGEGDIGS